MVRWFSSALGDYDAGDSTSSSKPTLWHDRRMGRSLAQRVHNPRGRECGRDPDCWCKRTALGRAVKWWFPARYVGLHHKSSALPLSE
jgi:hypothetical protein